MMLTRIACMALLIGLAATVAMASPVDPTVVINQHNDPACGDGVVCVSDLSNFSLSVPAGAFATVLDYTGDTSVTELQLLFVNPQASISCQTDIFQLCSSLPEIVGGEPALLLLLTGAGPCESNGVNSPAAFCPGVINPGDSLDFAVLSPGFGQAQTVSFVPEPSTLLLFLGGLGPAIAIGRKRWGMKRPS
jgi:hypothetical protein